MITRCRWCGDDHDETALCQRAQRGRSRRSFLFLAGAGTAGLLLAPEVTVAETYGDITTATYAHWKRVQYTPDVWRYVMEHSYDALSAEMAMGRWCQKNGIVRGADAVYEPPFERSPHAKPGDPARTPANVEGWREVPVLRSRPTFYQPPPVETVTRVRNGRRVQLPKRPPFDPARLP